MKNISIIIRHRPVKDDLIMVAIKNMISNIVALQDHKLLKIRRHYHLIIHTLACIVYALRDIYISQ